jgi:hypothetical protein
MIAELLAFAAPTLGAVIWYLFVAQIPFSQLGDIETIVDMLGWESEQTQKVMLSRFSMTRFEWYRMKRKHGLHIAGAVTELALQGTQGMHGRQGIEGVQNHQAFAKNRIRDWRLSVKRRFR